MSDKASLEKEYKKANVRAGFVGFKFAHPSYALTFNNLNPKLNFYEDFIDFRGGFKSKKIYYKDIKQVDIYIVKKLAHNLNITMENSCWRYIADFKKLLQLKEFLILLEEKGCHLSYDAKQFTLND